MGLVMHSIGLWKEASGASDVGQSSKRISSPPPYAQGLAERASLRRAIHLEKKGHTMEALRIFEGLQQASDSRVRSIAQRHIEVRAGRAPFLDQLEFSGSGLLARITDPKTLLPLAASGIVARSSQLLGLYQLKNCRFLARELGAVMGRAWVGTLGFSAEMLVFQGLERVLHPEGSLWGRAGEQNPFWAMFLGLGGMRLGAGAGRAFLKTRHGSPYSWSAKLVQEGTGFAGMFLGSLAHVYASDGPKTRMGDLFLQSALTQLEFGMMASVLRQSFPGMSRLHAHWDRQLDSLGGGLWVRRLRDWQPQVRQLSPVGVMGISFGGSSPSRNLGQVFGGRLYSGEGPTRTQVGYSPAMDGVPQRRVVPGAVTEPHTSRGSNSYSGTLPVQFIEGKVLGREDVLLLPESTPGLRGSYPLVEVRKGLHGKTVDCTFVNFPELAPMSIAVGRTESLGDPARFYLVPRQALSTRTVLEQAGSLMTYQDCERTVHVLYLGKDAVTLGRHSSRGLENDTSVSRQQATLTPWGGGQFVLTNLSRSNYIKVIPQGGTEYVVPCGGQAMVQHGDQLVVGRHQRIGLVDLLKASNSGGRG